MKVRASSDLILVKNTMVFITLLLHVYCVHVIVAVAAAAATTTTERNQNYYKDVPKSKGCGSTISNGSYSAGDTSWYANQNYKGQTLPVLYTLPSQYDKDKPVPLHFYFHGYGSTPGEGSPLFNDFANAKANTATTTNANNNGVDGIMSVALTGMGVTGGVPYPSWNGFGSTDSPNGISGRTCNAEVYCAEGDFCMDDCSSSSANGIAGNGDGVCGDTCWWTTCQDSVEQTKELLEQVLNEFCIDLSRIFVSGSSNGGMFLHELANDKRTAPYLAGILPQVGLPHYGHNNGPASTTDNVDVEPISYFGIWGANDTTVPPSENEADDGTIVECRSSEQNGWFYTTADCVTKYWAKKLQCNDERELIAPSFPLIKSCWTYKNCNNKNNDGTTNDTNNVEVSGCIVDTNHYGPFNFANNYLIEFIYSHPKIILSNDDDPIAVCTANGTNKKKCNMIEGCSWKRKNSKKKMCKEALSNKLCKSKKKKQCRKKGCVWKKNKKKCKGRW